MTIQGSGARRTLDGANSHRAFDIRVGGYSVTINDLTLDKMQSPAGSGTDAVGAAILSAPLSGGRVTLELNRVTISNSSAWYSGNTGHSGAMAVGWTNLTINDSVFDGNRGTTSGAMQVSGNVTATINRSVFRNNVAQIYGGAIRLFAGTVTVNNSSFYNNTVENNHATSQGYGGAIEVDDGGTLNLNHVTITNNTVKNATSNRGGGLANILISSTTTVRVRNSIIFGNTPEDCYQTIALSVNIGNIIGSGNCGAGTNGSSQDPGLRGPENGYYLPKAGGPAIDAVTCLTSTVTNKWNEDLRGETRPKPAGGQCDRGAIEDPGWSPPPPQVTTPRTDVSPPPGDDRGGSGGGGDDDDDDEDESAVTAPPVSTCLTLAGIAAYNLSESTQCQRVNALQIANPDIKDGDFVDAVDVWSWVMPNTQICFAASGGSFTFIDTAAMPRTVQAWAACSLNGMTCASLDGPGMLVLLPGEPPADCAAPDAQISAQSLSNCMVRTQFNLNFRAAPDGEITGGVPHNATLTALERTSGWFKVDYHGERGWIAAEFVETKGTCD